MMTTTTILGRNNDFAHKLPTLTLGYDTVGYLKAAVTSAITSIYCRINIE